MSRPAAFFDMDRTLLAVNSGSLWIKSEVRGGHLSRWDALRGLFHIARYHLGVAAIEAVLLDAVRMLGGSLESELAARTLAFYEREIAHQVRAGSPAALEKHRCQGHPLVLLTTSSNYLAGPVAEALGMDDYLCSRFVVDADGRFTGEPIRPLCYGQGKVEIAEAWAAERGISVADSWFYSDSASDLPMLEHVGHPVAVHPDPRLKRRAKQAGWPIEDWS